MQSGAPDPASTERPIEGPNDVAADKVNKGGDATPQTLDEVATGEIGGGGHRPKICPSRLLDETVTDADVGPGQSRFGFGGVDPHGRQEVLERTVAMGGGFNRHQLQIMGRKRS